MLGCFGQLTAEGDGAAPEGRRPGCIDEDAVPDLPREQGAEREQTDRHENGQRAFVRVVSAAADGHAMRIVRAVAVLLVRTLVFAMERVLDMLRRGPARLAEEGQENETPGIETGQQRRERTDPERDRARDRAARPGAFDDRVLRPEAGETEAAAGQVDADAGDRQRADNHHPERYRD